MSATFLRLLVFGEALADFVKTYEGLWQSAPGGACWNVARVAATLGVETGWCGAVSRDFSVVRSSSAPQRPNSIFEACADADRHALFHA